MADEIQYDYEYQELTELPQAMDPWHLRFMRQGATEFGKYSLVEVTQAYIELHHQVEVVDEGGDPLRGVWVFFGCPGGGCNDFSHLVPSTSEWGRFTVLNGNAVKTNAMGYAQHTFGSGGETIFMWDLDENNKQKLSSDFIENASSVGTEQGAPFIHTGVRLVFQRRKKGIPVKSQRRRLDEIEAGLGEIKATLQALRDEAADDRLVALEAEFNALKDTQSVRIENLELRLELLSTQIERLQPQP